LNNNYVNNIDIYSGKYNAAISYMLVK